MIRNDGISLHELKARVSLAEIAGRDVQWDARRSNFRRGDLWACCPFHQEKTPSFHVDVRKGVFKCFGCGAGGDLITYVRQRYGLDFRGALEWLAREAGLSDGYIAPVRQSVAWRQQPMMERRGEGDERRRLARARAIWRATRPAIGTPVHEYLMGRGIEEAPPDSLRFHPALWRSRDHGEGPAMVAVMVGPEGCFAGVHRTWLERDADTGWRKAQGEGVKKMLGVARGAAVRLTPPAATVYVAEGIETSMAVLQVLRRQGKMDVGVFAALSMGNMGRVWLPPDVREVVLVADNDTKDWRAVRRAMREAASMHAQHGRNVRMVWPPRGKDYLDWVNGECTGANT